METKFSKNILYMKMIKKRLGMGYFDVFLGRIFTSKKDFEVDIKGRKIKIRSGIGSLARLMDNGWNVLPLSEDMVQLENNYGIKISCRTDMGLDLVQLEEIFIDEIYKCHIVDKNVIDVGMNNGDSSIYFAKKGAKKVLGIEPDLRNYDIGLKNIRDSGVDNMVTAINRAVSNEKSVEIKMYEAFPNSNSFPEFETSPKKDNAKICVVDGITLGDIIDMFEGETIGLLKMDCEGCEYSNIEKLEERHFKKIENIIMEYHQGPKNLPSILETMGFRVDLKKYGVFQGMLIASRI